MNIVHIGRGTTVEEIEHITEQRDAGHDYFVPGDSTYEQLVRRIMDADEIHIWDITKEFELGMIYFFSVEALHHKLHWRIVIFDKKEAPYTAWFEKIQLDHAAAVDHRQQFVESVRVGETVFTPIHVSDLETVTKIEDAGQLRGPQTTFTPSVEVKLPCAGNDEMRAIPCGECGNQEECLLIQNKFAFQ